MSRVNILYFGVAILIVIFVFAFIYCNISSAIKGVNGFGSALYFSVVTITTLGFGDMVPVSQFGKVMVCLEALSGVVIVGLFLNTVSNQQALKINKQEEERNERVRFAETRAKLRQYYMLLESIMNNYLVGAYVVVTPLERRKFDLDVMRDRIEFSFNDMCDLYETSLLLASALNKSSIVIYFESQERLYAELRSMIGNIDLSYWEQLETDIHTFMQQCNNFAFKDSILWSINTPAAPLNSKMIKEHEGELKMLPSNAKNQFIALYNLLQINISLVQRMAAEMKQCSETD